MHNFHRIIWYHKCVCGILLRKLKKYSKYTMKTCQENSWHIYMMCYFNLHRMTYAGVVKRSKSHFENCNNGPEETAVQGDCSYILTTRATGAARPSLAGPECKKVKFPVSPLPDIHNHQITTREPWVRRMLHRPDSFMLSILCMIISIYLDRFTVPTVSQSKPCAHVRTELGSRGYFGI